MKPHADAIALCLMLGEKFTSWEYLVAAKEAGIDTNALWWLALHGYVRHMSPAESPLQPRYVVTEAGKEYMR